MHKKVLEKIRLVKNIVKDIENKHMAAALPTYNSAHITDMHKIIDEIETNYTMQTIEALVNYYKNDVTSTRVYYRILTEENYFNKIDVLVNTIERKACSCVSDTSMTTSKIEVCKNKCTYAVYGSKIANDINIAKNIKIIFELEKTVYENCICGSRMHVRPELSELVCMDCGIVKTIIGTVFRDEQFYPQDGQKTKHCGYDIGRHYHFWMERLQALESKTFTDEEINAMEAILDRDNVDRRKLRCEDIRALLKNPAINSTKYNDHAPLLVKILGGVPPPQLNFEETRLCGTRFNITMRLYDIVKPSGGNKPYYPYFIYKILEHMLKDNPEKLRILDYIHLQSRETVIKNDKYFKEICELASVKDGLVYTPTDPTKRIK